MATAFGLTEVRGQNISQELAYRLMRGSRFPVVTIYSGDAIDSELDNLVKSSFLTTGIKIEGDDQFLKRDKNFLTVAIADRDHAIRGQEIVKDLPDVVYQIGKFDTSSCPLLTENFYVNVEETTPISELGFINEQLGGYYNTSQVGYVTRFGTSKDLLTVPRMTRRLKVAKAMRRSMGQVLSHPLFKDTQIFVFETTPTRAEAFRFALNAPLYKSDLRYNKDGYPLNALLTDDYVTLSQLHKQHVGTSDIYKQNLQELRQDLNIFLESIGIRNHFALSSAEQVNALKRYLDHNPISNVFINKYLYELATDRVGLYYFFNQHIA
ncbi:MAG: hypothetical protein US52_C0047G0007 [candidate division WS6 bacterium GW2011_GWA2_37_6]|uniref:Uncharacterized protein n=1 Tax=candidate division WS6 bacterium GW2011_GWA2_37_6 TaxID=1619087 RepID=A0A0G0GXM4_9BACT|nr:MAG: hypothetical protein US52_C0047G0007 [candidate division WS6 bacterium GW2011_GWA2_37_6]